MRASCFSRGIPLKAGFILSFIIVFIVALLYAAHAGAESTAVSDTGAREYSIGSGWQYSSENLTPGKWDDAQWTPYVINNRVAGTDTLWFRVKLPGVYIPGPLLEFWTNSKKIDVYLEDKLVYTDDFLEQPGLRRTNDYGHTLELPQGYADKYIYISMNTRGTFARADSFGGALVCSYKSYVDSGLRSGMELFVFGVILVFISLLLSIVALFVRIDIQSFGSFCLLALCCGVDLLTLTFTPKLLHAPTLWYYAAGLSSYLMPAGICIFLMQYRSSTYKKIIDVIWKLFLLHAAVMFILDLAGICPMYTTQLYYFIAFAAVAVLLIAFSIVDIKNTSRESRVILIGAVSFGATGMIDLFHGIFRAAVNYTPIYPWGLFIFVVTLILSMVLKYNGFYRKSVVYAEELNSKNKSLREAWEEIKSAHDEVAEVNKTLERRVAERTEQLEMANNELTALNEELTAMNEELTATMEALSDAQVQLVQSEKISSMGRLISGIAHELNNPVGVIKSYMQLEENLHETMDINNENDIKKYFETVSSLREAGLQASDRISGIVKNLTNFSRLDESEYKEANLNDCIESTLSILEQQLNSKKIIVERKYSKLPWLACYPKLLNQAFLNIFENAMEAIGSSGKIIIRTGYELSAIYIKIRDTGKGIPPESLQKIFDPGYTTKGVSIGTGLGLAISYRIIEKHSGSITAGNAADGGAEFTILLPCKEPHTGI